MRILNRSFVLMAAVACAGCVSWENNPPLLFGEVQSIGITVGGSATQQGADITVGYRSQDVAIVPVTIAQGPNASTQLKATAGGHEDALSVLGQFESSAKSTEVGLGKFFSTGIAAKRLADGFATKMGDSAIPANPADK